MLRLTAAASDWASRAIVAIAARSGASLIPSLIIESSRCYRNKPFGAPAGREMAGRRAGIGRGAVVALRLANPRQLEPTLRLLQAQVEFGMPGDSAFQARGRLRET